MKRQILLTLLPCLLIASTAEAVPLKTELDATLCYIRLPGFFDLSYTLCGVTNPLTFPNSGLAGNPSSLTSMPGSTNQRATRQFSRSPNFFTPQALNNPFQNQQKLRPGGTLNTGELNAGGLNTGTQIGGSTGTQIGGSNSPNTSQKYRGNCLYEDDRAEDNSRCGDRAVYKRPRGANSSDFTYQE